MAKPDTLTGPEINLEAPFGNSLDRSVWTRCQLQRVRNGTSGLGVGCNGIGTVIRKQLRKWDPLEGRERVGHFIIRTKLIFKHSHIQKTSSI